MRNYDKYYRKSVTKSLMLLFLFWLALLSKITPKLKGLTLYGSMSGFKIADNSKYAFLNDSTSKYSFFITKNKENMDFVFNNGIKPVYAYSFKGIILQLFAQKIFFSHGLFDFISPLIWGSEKHNLWHGVPIKEIGPTADWKYNSNLMIVFKKLFYQTFGYMYYMYCDYVYCPNLDRFPDYKRYFSISNPKIVLRGQPRNTFAKKNISINRVLFAPTYRKYIKSRKELIEYLDNIKIFDKNTRSWLLENDIKLFIRPHPIDHHLYINLQLDPPFYLDLSNDLYDSITSYILVITDYSSIYFDCLELNIDCVFLAPDLDRYQKEVGLSNNLVNVINKHNIKSFTLLNNWELKK